MRRDIALGVTAMLSTWASAPLVRQALIQWGSMDVPNHRSSHTTPVPRGGGLACATGISVGLATARGTTPSRRKVVIGLIALTLTGLADDQLGNVHYSARLAVQALAGCLFSETALTMPLAAVVSTGVVNVVNFMDGINGISGSTAAVWGISSVAVGHSEDDPWLAMMGAVTAGAGLGFLPWNTPTAHLFLGDVGSYLLGGLMGASIARHLSRPAVAWRTSAPLLLYGLDATQAVVRRRISGQKLTEAHREHIYQQLVDSAGMSHAQVAALHAVGAAGIAFAASSKCPLVAVPAIALIGASYLNAPRVARRLRLRGAIADHPRA